MAFIIGLGGSGTRFVRTMIDQDNPVLEGALTIDVIEVERGQKDVSESARLSKWKHLSLVNKNSTLESVIRAGINSSFNSEDTQLSLKQLASWRPSSRKLSIALTFGAGRFRSIGRAISNASRSVLQTEIAEINSHDICVVTSIDGGTGSGLLIDILKIIDERNTKVNIVVIALDSMGSYWNNADIAFFANSIATLCELETYLAQFAQVREHQFNDLVQVERQSPSEFMKLGCAGLRSITVINSEIGDHIQLGIEQLPDRIEENFGKEVDVHNQLRDFGQDFHARENSEKVNLTCLETGINSDLLVLRYFESQKRQADEEMQRALDFSVGRFKDRAQFLTTDPAQLGGMWAYCRSRILTEFVEPEIVTRCIRGWLIALCLNRIQIEDQEVRIVSEQGETNRFFTLRPIDANGIDALPSIIEAAPIARRGDPLSSSFGYDAINTLMRYADVIPKFVASEDFRQISESVSTFQADFRTFIGLGTPTKNSLGINNMSESQSFRVNLITQKELSLRLVQLSYHGDEAVDPDGRISPPETFFRDIVVEYLEEIDRLLFMPASTSKIVQIADDLGNNPSQGRSEIVIRSRIKRNRPLSGRLAATNAKPFAWIRYGVPVLLGIISTVIYFSTLNSQVKQQSWANSATIVSGFMAGFAVCLGSIALISSIQNSSIRIQRTDRLYEACLGVQEAVTFFELGKEAAIATNDPTMDPRNLWNDPSLHLASMMLGLKLKSAMDTGLYRLLAYADEKNGITAGTINSASALQAFSLLDGLVRIAPEIVYEKDRPRSENTATPAQIAEIANKLNENLSQITYKMVAKSLEFTPSTNL